MASDQPSVFETTAEYEQTRADYYQEQLNNWIITPLGILWSDWRGKIGLSVVVFYVLVGVIGVQLWPAPQVGQGPKLLPALNDPAHPLGTDNLGRDMLSLMVHATPDMLKMILSGAVFGTFLGVVVGLISGYLSGAIDKILMTITDTVMSIPGIPLLIVLSALIQPTNPFLIGIVLAMQRWAGLARNVRSQVFPLVDKEHVEASRIIGQPMSSIVVFQVLPHLLPYIFIGFLGGATAVVFASIALYFLGILPFSTLNWGVVLNSAYTDASVLYSMKAAHWLVVPLVTLVGLTVGLTLLAQAFDQVFNPRVRARHQKQKDVVLDQDRQEGEVSAEFDTFTQ